MRVLSLIEPWASLIMEEKKLIETRSWKTNYRGEIYIHASQKKLTNNQRVLLKKQLSLLSHTDFNYGFIIAKCVVVDCIYMDEEFIDKIKQNKKEYLCGDYQVGRYAWILSNVVPLKQPIKAKGMLGIWKFDSNEF